MIYGLVKSDDPHRIFKNRCSDNAPNDFDVFRVRRARDVRVDGAIISDRISHSLTESKTIKCKLNFSSIATWWDDKCNYNYSYMNIVQWKKALWAVTDKLLLTFHFIRKCWKDTAPTEIRTKNWKDCYVC